MMEWNAKTPCLWDWESPMVFSGNPRQEPAELAIGSGSVYSSAAAGDCSASSSKSSIDSSSHAGIRAPSLNIEAFDDYRNRRADSTSVQDTGASPAAAPPPQEPLIGLKLGKRTYFEDLCPGSSSARKPASSSSASSSPSAAAALVKRSKASHQSMQITRCQVEGCTIDLAGAKDYHRKHRVCENHSKFPRVIVAGQERRFCQQCSRFHEMSAFDENKRSCRRRLSDHNARRRKPQPDTISSNSASLTSSFYGNGQQINFLLNKARFGDMRPSASSTWDGSCDFNLAHVKGPWIKSTKGGDIEAQLLMPDTALSNVISTLPHDLDSLLPFKGITSEILNQGPEASSIASNLSGAPDIGRALSLLSMESWGSADPSGLTSSLTLPLQTNDANTAHQASIQAANMDSNYRQDGRALAQEARAPPFAMHSNRSQFQEFQLLKAPYETTFFDSSRIH